MESGRARHVLFLCTGNSARSILAEALLARDGAGRFVADSAGSFPKGAVHPLALALLRREGLKTDGLRSKSWDEFARAGAPAIDLAITVCDAAAAESCPAWPGSPARAHWGLPDPAAVEGPLAAREAAFSETFRMLETRIRSLVALPFDSLPPAELARRLAAIGAAAEAPA